MDIVALVAFVIVAAIWAVVSGYKIYKVTRKAARK